MKAFDYVIVGTIVITTEVLILAHIAGGRGDSPKATPSVLSITNEKAPCSWISVVTSTEPKTAVVDLDCLRGKYSGIVVEVRGERLPGSAPPPMVISCTTGNDGAVCKERLRNSEPPK